jgi:hypothetical protein
MFPSLALEVKEVRQLDAAAFDDESLTEAIAELGRLETQLTAARNRLIGEWDRRGAWRSRGARTASAGLAALRGEAKQECTARIGLERALSHLPLVAEAVGAGDITMAHARLLAGARNTRTARLLSRDEGMLVTQAMGLSFSEFVRVVEYWRMHADPDGAEQTDLDRRDRRRVSLDVTIGGMRSGSILLDPISGEIVGGELDRLEQRLFEAEWAVAKERLGRDPLAGELERTPDQRRADALVEMASRSAMAPADGKAPKPLFQVILGSDAFSHLLQLASGQVLPPSALLPWLSSADLERYVFDGGRERVISVSYRRTFDGALRDLIAVRDRFCYHETCDIPAHRCQVDHVEPWSAGGITSQSNGRVACGFHNRLRHRPRPPPR